MKKTTKTVLFATILAFVYFYSVDVRAQSKARVENVDFFLEGENLIITYDIVKAKSEETFDVSVDISTDKGTTLKAYTITGDVGAGVNGGNLKRISWDMKSDNIYIDDEIFVEVFAEPIYQEIAKKTSGEVSVGGAMLRSLVFPGWGNRYAKGGGAYWLIGIAAYGAAGSAVYFNYEANNRYEDYKNSTDLDQTERDKLYQDANDYYDMRNSLMIAAGAIWVADIIWAGMQARNMNKRARQSNVSVGYYYDPVARTPMFSVSLNLK